MTTSERIEAMSEKLGKFGHHPDEAIDAEIEVEILQGHLANAHTGLRRALDFRAATPQAIGIKEDVRRALETSGFTGPYGYREQC